MSILFIYLAIGAVLTYLLLWGIDWSDDKEAENEIIMVREAISALDPIMQVGILLFCCVYMPAMYAFLIVQSFFE